MSKNNFASRFMEISGNDVYKESFDSKQLVESKKKKVNEFHDLPGETADSFEDEPQLPAEGGEVDDLNLEDRVGDSENVNVDELEAAILAAVSSAFDTTFNGGAVIGEEGVGAPELETEPSLPIESDEEDLPEPRMTESIGRKITEAVFESLKAKGFIRKVDKK